MIASVPVNLRNPGQVFASLGLLEAAALLLGEAEAGFDWSDPAGTRFVVRAAGDHDPVEAVLRFLAEARVESLAPAGSGNSTERWNVPTRVSPLGAPFPSPDPGSPATLPARLEAGGQELTIEHWSDATRRDNVKFWAGSGGYPGAGLARDALDLVRIRLRDAAADPFELSAAQSSSFRFDWRRDYVPIDAGFSLNSHPAMEPRGYPLVELLAAVGLSHGRPLRVDKLSYRYGVAGRASASEPAEAALLPPLLLRAALGCAALPIPMRTFHIHLDWPGQEGQARSITTVSEEIR